MKRGKKGKTIHFQLLLNIHKPSQNKYLELLNIVTTPYLPGSASTSYASDTLKGD